MRMKTFHAESMPEAIEMVRVALGDAAIIIGSQRGEGGRGVRVTAAIDESEEDNAPPPPVDQPLDALEAIADALDRHGAPAALTERLLVAATPLAERLVRAATAMAVDAPVMTMAAALDTLFLFDALPEKDAIRPILLVGPPGSGKTITTAKLAARAVLSNQPVNIITTDTLRAGGVDQLQAFTRILDLDLMTALDAGSLRDGVAAGMAANPGALTLIDTGGANPFNRQDLDDLSRLIDRLPLDIVLVLSAGIDCEEAAATARAFAGIGARRLLVTRLDAARRLGSVLVAADVAGLRFCNQSVTPNVADGLDPINPVSLAKLLLPELSATMSVISRQEIDRP